MPRASSPILLIAIVSTAVGAHTSSTLADDNAQWQPVDQSVSDLDLRATSSRRVEQGIGVYGQTGSLFRRPDSGQGSSINGQPLTQQYQLREPGFTAWIDRPDYLVQDPLGEFRLNIAPSQDGQFIDLIPPNTVFDLDPTTPNAFVPYTDFYDDGLGNTRVNTRIDGWVDTPVSGEPVRQLLPLPTAHRLPPHLMAERASRAPTPADTSPTQNTSEQVPAEDPPSE